MKKLFFLLFVLVTAMACGQSKKVYLNDFKKFVNDVKQNAEQYKEADWKKADQQFADFKEAYRKYDKELTTDEKTEISKLESSYTGVKVKKVANEMQEDANDAIDKVKDTAKEVAKDVKDGAKKAVKKSKKVVEGVKEGWNN